MIQMFKNIYKYRELLKKNIKKEIRGKYKQSTLGIMWSFLNPLLQLAIYSFIFPLILRNTQENYVIFLCVALIPWIFFTTIVTQSAGIVITNSNIIKKVYFPREILPISVVTSQLVNFLISTIIMIMFVVFFGVGLSKFLLFYPIILLIQYVFSIGIAFIVSSITVYLRDLEHLIGLAMMMLFYVTPIAYASNVIPEKFSFIITINPMAHLINAYRDIFYYQRMPDMGTLGIIFAIAVILFIAGYYLFNRLQRNFAEEL